jgi:hypothetical protein
MRSTSSQRLGLSDSGSNRPGSNPSPAALKNVIFAGKISRVRKTALLKPRLLTVTQSKSVGSSILLSRDLLRPRAVELKGGLFRIRNGDHLRLLSEKRLHDLAFGEYLVWSARRRGRMDLSGTGKRLAQIYTPAGLPDEPYGACHLLTLDYH